MATRTGIYNLWKLESNLSGWHHFYNHNLELLDSVFPKLLSLSDISIVELRDKSIIRYHENTGKWEVVYDREV